MKTEIRMDDMTEVRRAVDRLLAGEVGPLLDLLAEDVEFEVASGGDVSGSTTASGKEPIAEYFTALGGIVAFWQMDYTARGRQVIAWGKERFTVDPCGFEGGCEFALVLELDEGKITRFMVIEDLAAYMRVSSHYFELGRLRARGGGPGPKLGVGIAPEGGDPPVHTGGARRVMA